MENTIKRYPNLDYIYTHYKGGKYQVITLAKHSETGEDMVVYKSLLFGSVYVRPLAMWFDIITNVKHPKYKHRPLGDVQRFS
jgi:hypothetical protein